MFYFWRRGCRLLVSGVGESVGLAAFALPDQADLNLGILSIAHGHHVRNKYANYGKERQDWLDRWVRNTRCWRSDVPQWKEFDFKYQIY